MWNEWSCYEFPTSMRTYINHTAFSVMDKYKPFLNLSRLSRLICTFSRLNSLCVQNRYPLIPSWWIQSFATFKMLNNCWKVLLEQHNMQDLYNQNRKMPRPRWQQGSILSYVTGLILKSPVRHPKDTFKQHGSSMTSKHHHDLTQVSFPYGKTSFGI